MLRPGAVGATGDEIDEVLHFPTEGLGPAYNALTRSWQTGEPTSKKSPELAIANAVFLEATWETEFDANDTHDAPFFVGDGERVEASTMHSAARYELARGDGWSAVRLPYAKSDLSMWVLLPDVDAGVTPVDLLDAEVLTEAGDTATAQDVRLALPSWDFQSDLPLVETLQDLGMEQAFTPSADFSALTSAPLQVSDVIHRADITVDEEGTEAAAVTGIGMVYSGQIRPPGVELNVDRPFAVAIIDDASGAPVFEGVVHDPTA